MDHFSIAELSRLSGVKPFTIRIWEKRYEALRPGRSEGNTRFYNNQQLRRLLNIVSLLEFDYKVSELCVLPDSSLFRLLEEKKIPQEKGLEGFFISQLVASGISYDEGHFTNIFAQCVGRFGVRNAYVRVIYPMLQRVGILWSANRINASNEHFITNLLRQKLLCATDLLPSPAADAESWLLYLPENEFHETGLLVAHYLIRLAGKKSVYLGANMPVEALKAAAAVTDPDNILLFLVHRDEPLETRRYLTKIAGLRKSSTIYAAGDRLTEQLGPVKKVKFLESVEQLGHAL